VCVSLYHYNALKNAPYRFSRSKKHFYTFHLFHFPFFSIDFSLVPQTRIQKHCNRVVPLSLNIRFNYVQAWDRGRVFATKLQRFNCREISSLLQSCCSIFSVLNQDKDSTVGHNNWPLNRFEDYRS